jgi:hypothetical protein
VLGAAERSCGARLGVVARGVPRAASSSPLSWSDGRVSGAAVRAGALREVAPVSVGRPVGRALSVGRVVGRAFSVGRAVGRTLSVGRVVGRAVSLGRAEGRAPSEGAVRPGRVVLGRVDVRPSLAGAASTPVRDVGRADPVAAPPSLAGGVRSTAGVAAGVAPEGRRTAVRTVEPVGLSLYVGPSRKSGEGRRIVTPRRPPEAYTTRVPPP